MAKIRYELEEKYHDGGVETDNGRVTGDYVEHVGLKCECGSISFHVLITAPWETSAKCTICGTYHVVHSG